MMSPTLLSKRLKDLEKEGIVERQGPPRGATYHLTEAGLEFAPIIEAMGVWGQRWTRRELEEDEIDLDLLLWGIEGSARAQAFGREPSLVQIEFTDQPKGKRFWWFLNEDGRCQLCVEDPGRDVDIYLSGSVPDVIRVYRGDMTISAALDQNRIELLGSVADRKAFPAWLNLSPLAKVASMRRA